MITGKENILFWYDSSGRKMWKLHQKGGHQIAEGVDESGALNRESLVEILDRVDPGKYTLQIAPTMLPTDSSKHLKCDINTSEGRATQPQHDQQRGMYGIGDVDRLVDQRMGAVLEDKLNILRKENEIEKLKDALKAKDGRGEVTPWEKFMMETIGALIPYAPSVIGAFTGKEVPPMQQPQQQRALPAAQNPAPKQPAAQPTTEQVPADIQQTRDRLTAAVNKIQKASPDNWLNTLEIVADKYAEKPQMLEGYLPMLQNL